jgi:hypothetical protein
MSQICAKELVRYASRATASLPPARLTLATPSLGAIQAPDDGGLTWTRPTSPAVVYLATAIAPNGVTFFVQAAWCAS